jgi:FKBP12-rapamycin complex-associated protein
MMEGLAAGGASSSSSVRSLNKHTLLSSSSEEAALHGSLLVLVELLSHTGNFMVPRFEEICEAVFSLIDDSKALIRLEVLRLSPILAQTCPGSFGRRFLGTSLDFIIQSASTPPLPKSTIDLRPCAFVSLGQLSLAVANANGVRGSFGRADPVSPTASSLQPNNALCLRLSDVFTLLRGGLTSTSASTSPNEVNITRATLHCAANVVHAVDQLSFPYIAELLDGMFDSGLSEDLIDSAQAIAIKLPSQQVS